MTYYSWENKEKDTKYYVYPEEGGLSSIVSRTSVVIVDNPEKMKEIIYSEKRVLDSKVRIEGERVILESSPREHRYLLGILEDCLRRYIEK